MAIIHRSKKIKFIIGAILSTVVVICGVTLFVFCLKRKTKNDEERITNSVEIQEENTIEQGEKQIFVTDDERYQHFDFISAFVGINNGDLVDVRISFPNGEDYIVISHKEIINVDEKGIVLRVNEEEILKMSSAQIDVNKYEGTKIYAVKYVSDSQKPAISYYLLNEYVLSLGEWDPNLIEKIFSQEKMKKRYDFEQNLVKFQIEKEVG